MKKNENAYLLFATALAAGILCFSCTRLDKDLVEPTSEPQQEEKTSGYTLTVQAHKGTPTKALADAGTTLTSSWAAGDNVDVYNANGEKLGTLTPAVSSSTSTTLSGNLDTAPAVEDVLTLKFKTNNYTNQEGTLEYIAANCDYATAEVTVTAVTGNAIQTTPAHFESRQAIVKFTLKAGDAALAVKPLLVNVGSTLYTVTPASATSELYVAFPAFVNRTVTLSAQAGSSVYELVKDEVTFEDGMFYRITPTLTKQTLGSISVTGLDASAPVYFYGGSSVSTAR